LPLARRFERAGHDVLLTARAYGDTFAILRSEGATFETVGTSFGKGLAHKLAGLAQRTRLLVDFVPRSGPPVDFVVTASRSAALAARRLRIPSFVILDYEHVNVVVYALAGSYVLHPRVINRSAFICRGIRPQHLIPFDGLKEGISFGDLDIDAAAPDALPQVERPRLLFRPPAEDSHYYRAASHELTLALLRHLASEEITLVFSPRDPRQIAYLDEVGGWRREPKVLHTPLEFVSLLKSVDAVVSAGGTMLREAAYLGVPAYSIFRGKIGAVDRYLESLGRLTLLTQASDFGRIAFAGTSRAAPLRDATDAASIAETILARAGSG
jgi:uncharacterized protein